MMRKSSRRMWGGPLKPRPVDGPENPEPFPWLDILILALLGLSIAIVVMRGLQ